MKTLTVTDEAVKRAAEKCPTAKEVLTELFPEAFKKPRIEFNLRRAADYELLLDGLVTELPSPLYGAIPGVTNEAKLAVIIELLMARFLPKTEYVIHHK